MPGKRRSSTKPQRPLKRKADRGAGKRLTFADRYRLLELHRLHPDWNFTDLAIAAGVSPETARLTCIAAGKSAADLMAAYAEPMLRNWIRASRTAGARGDHRPSRDWLLHAGSLEPLPETARGTGPAVVIINNPLPGMPGYAAPPTMTGPMTIDGENVATPARLPPAKK